MIILVEINGNGFFLEMCEKRPLKMVKYHSICHNKNF